MTDHGTVEPVAGKYVYVDIDGTTHRVYVEENGPADGIPLLCQHTAGANSRQWRHLLNDETITDDYRVVTYDLPHHGNSLPPDGETWWDEEYQLTAERFADTVVSIADALSLDDPIYMGSSMGGTLTLELADWYPDTFRALIGLEAGAFTPGFYMQWLDHPHVNATEVNGYAPSGLMAPQSPEQRRRENVFIYQQSASGVSRGDLYYYSMDHDYREGLADIDATETPMYLMNGEYDYLTNPEDARAAAAGIGEGATAVALRKVGHFPMTERPDFFAELLQEVLADIDGERDEPLPEEFAPSDFGIEPNRN
jgi:pimeloyl-ACP methyl ester carboxylesterase